MREFVEQVCYRKGDERENVLAMGPAAVMGGFKSRGMG